VHFIFLTFSVI